MTSPGAWTSHRLRAVLWVVHVLGPNGSAIDVVERSFPELPVGGLLGVADLRETLQRLRQLGLVAVVGNRLVPNARLSTACASTETPVEHVLGAILEAAPPAWLAPAGAGDEVRWELVPDADADALSSILEDPARREAFLISRARAVEFAARREVGARGEEFVARACRDELASLGRRDLADRVQIVSGLSDELGYDVTAPRLDGTVRRMEVKATRSLGPAVTVFLTRNEFRVGIADPDWSLVVARVADEDGGVLGWFSAPALRPALPRKVSDAVSWEVVRVRLRVADLVPGLPRVA